MAVAADSNLVYAVSLLAAGVVAVPLFKRLGLGSVLGYLAAGVVIGPFGLGFFTDPESILHAAGAGRARAVLICVDKPEVALKIIQTLRAEFPQARVLARAYDRAAAIQIIAEGVDYQIRETLESAMLFGQAALEAVGVERSEAAEIMEDVRRRDAARLGAQIAGGLQAGRGFMKGNMPVPTPLAPPAAPDA